MAKISEIDHVAITVEDMEKSLAFYKDILGMEVMLDFENNSKEMGTLLGVPGAHIRSVVLKKGARAKGMVELITFYSPRGDPILPPKRNINEVCGPWLLSFEVDDVKQLYQELSGRGIKFVSPPQPLEIQPLGLYQVAILEGPDGLLIELLQRPENLREV